MAEHEPANGSVSELVQRMSQQTSTLVRQEMQLALAEMKEKGKHAGIGVGMMGGAALMGLCALGSLVAAAILGLAETGLDMWASALIVAAAFGVVAGIMVLMGKKEVAEAIPPKPEKAMESVQADIAEVKARAHA